eukprot:CAMPEP_0194349014 /NCGR_PEP_ID=MMETSP0171-20130528/106854_1 /TAXON_ID=218684 /ORGANISM="Corethron pennatum, Strain L29A3" /LENGTH=348 /DNA_ID=CAMNT_0039116417 /DNA_START=82 /DNA_END=1125 /DNA_ORIENTATION=+
MTTTAVAGAIFGIILLQIMRSYNRVVFDIALERQSLKGRIVSMHLEIDAIKAKLCESEKKILQLREEIERDHVCLHCSPADTPTLWSWLSGKPDGNNVGSKGEELSFSSFKSAIEDSVKKIDDKFAIDSFLKVRQLSNKAFIGGLTSPITTRVKDVGKTIASATYECLISPNKFDADVNCWELETFGGKISSAASAVGSALTNSRDVALKTVSEFGPLNALALRNFFPLLSMTDLNNFKPSNGALQEWKSLASNVGNQIADFLEKNIDVFSANLVPTIIATAFLLTIGAVLAASCEKEEIERSQLRRSHLESSESIMTYICTFTPLRGFLFYFSGGYMDDLATNLMSI